MNRATFLKALAGAAVLGALPTTAAPDMSAMYVQHVGDHENLVHYLTLVADNKWYGTHTIFLSGMWPYSPFAMPALPAGIRVHLVQSPRALREYKANGAVPVYPFSADAGSTASPAHTYAIRIPEHTT